MAPAQDGSGTDPAGTFETTRQEAAAWLAASWDPQLTVRDWWARLAESGWGFPQWPREWFGRGLRADAVAGARAAFTAAGALGPPASLGQLLGAPTLLVHGSGEQKERFLPLLARGEEAWCQFFSEPGSGSDLASAQTRAVRDGDIWTVDGQKVWTSGAQSADRGMLLARTNRDVPKHQGLSYFIIDVRQPGIEVRPLHQMNGAHGFNEVFFTGASADADRLVGEEGGGWSVAVTTLMYERFMSSLPSVAPGRRAGQLDRPAGEAASGAARMRARGRTGVSQVIIEVARQLGLDDDPVTRQRLAALSGQETAARLPGPGRPGGRPHRPAAGGAGLAEQAGSLRADPGRPGGRDVGARRAGHAELARHPRPGRDPDPRAVQPGGVHRGRDRRDPARHRQRAGARPAQGAAHRPGRAVPRPDHRHPAGAGVNGAGTSTARSLVTPARLAEFFAPRSIALVGASEASGWARFIAMASAAVGFTGPMTPVHPRIETAFGRPVVRSLRDIADPPDLAFILAPTEAVESVIDDAAATGVRHAIVLASGYREVGEAGRELERSLVARAAEAGIILLGATAWAS